MKNHDRSARTLRGALLLFALLCGNVATAQVGGFPNVPQVPGTLLSGLNAPEQGRTALIAMHGGILFTVPEIPSSEMPADFQVRTWDISDPAAPVELAQWGVTQHPIDAHGYVQEGPDLVLGPNYPADGPPWSFRVDSAGNVTRATSPGGDCTGGRGCLYQPWYAGQTWWSYNQVGGNASLLKLTPECGWGCVQPLAEWDHLGLTGVVGHPFLIGNLLIFASDQSRTGVATYDVSDPTNPVLLDVLNTGGPGGYWPEIWGGDGRLYIVFPYRLFGNGFRVVDITDPTDLRFVADRPLPGVEAMYAQFQDEYAFIGSHKVDLRTFESVVFFDPLTERTNQPGTLGIDTSQFALPVGNLLVTGGIGPSQGMAIWAHQAEPDTRGPSVGFHIPRAGQTNYPLGAPISLLIHETLESGTIINGTTFLVRPLGGGAAVPGRLVFSFNDVLTFTPDEPLLPDTTYEVVVPAGGIKDVAGNGIEAYSFTFSTGASAGGNRPPAVDDLVASAYPVAPGQPVTLSGSVSDPDGDPLEVRFDFGDGSPRTAWSTTATAVTSFAAPGHYRVALQARDPSGLIATLTRTVTVLEPPAATQPTNSSQVVCDAGAGRVWAVNPDNDVLSRVDADSLVRDLEVGVCDDPRGVARAADGSLWLACFGDDRLVVVSDGGALLAALPLGYGSAPAGIVAVPDGATMFVAAEGRGELRRFDTATRQQTGSLALGPRPRALAVSGDGARVLVTRLISETDYAEVWDVDAVSLTLNRTIRIPKFGGDANRDATSSGRGVANYLVGIVIAPDGETAWVAANKPNSERGLLIGPDLDQDNTVRNVIVQLDLASGAVRRAIDLDNSDSASALAFSPFGDYLFVTLQGNNEILVFDALRLADTSGLGASVTRLGTGRAPQSLCFDPATRRTFTADLLSRSVTALETDAFFVRGDISVTATGVPIVSEEAMPAAVLRGKQIFYDASDPRMSPEGYLSCASCHLDGGHDGRVWDFTGRGEGLRNTITLHGRSGTGHGNVHWSGNFDEIQDFENDIREAFGGSGFLDDADYAITRAPLGAAKAGRSADLDALAAYVASLDAASVPRSPWRNPDGSLTATAADGRDIYFALGCEDCHAGAAASDSSLGAATLHDVGTRRTTSGGRLGQTLDGIDTPTLIGAWETAPYLHDGSAATLDDVFRVVGGQVYPAEDATPSGGASIIDQWVELNSDDTVHGRALAYFGPTPARLVFTGVDGGSGGAGAVELRYSNGYPIAVDIVVNGVVHATTLQMPANDPPWAHLAWARARVDGVVLQPGATNVIEIVPDPSAGWADISLDEIVVGRADEVAAAAPHRVALGLEAGDRAALVSYLLQIDGRDDQGQLPAGTPTATPTPTLTIPPATPTPTMTAPPTATPGALCPPAPRPDCAAPLRSRLRVTSGDGARRKLLLRWEGTAQLADFGNPLVAGEAYQLCLYVGGALALQADLPFGGLCGSRPCWSGDARRGYRMNDRGAANAGLRRMQVRQSRDRVRLQLAGAGSGLTALAASPGAVLGQLSRLPGQGCWESGGEIRARGN